MYALHLLAPFTFLTLAVVALIIGMVNREHVQGSWLDSHYSWLSRTFWWGLLWAVIAWGLFILLSFRVPSALNRSPAIGEVPLYLPK